MCVIREKVVKKKFINGGNFICFFPHEIKVFSKINKIHKTTLILIIRFRLNGKKSVQANEKPINSHNKHSFFNCSYTI